MSGRDIFPAVLLVIMMGLLLMFSPALADGLWQNTATATPSGPGVPDLVPPIGGIEVGAGGGSASPVDLEALARLVEQANLDEGATTFWQGGVLGVGGSSRLSIKVGEKLPAIGLMAQSGLPFRSDLLDIPYLLNFWASWCGPCVYEFPLLIERSSSGNAAFGVAFVNVLDDPLSYERFLVDYPDELLAMIDIQGTVPELYRLDMIPVSVLIDGEGNVRMIQVGPVNSAALDLAEALLAGG